MPFQTTRMHRYKQRNRGLRVVSPTGLFSENAIAVADVTNGLVSAGVNLKVQGIRFQLQKDYLKFIS